MIDIIFQISDDMLETLTAEFVLEERCWARCTMSFLVESSTKKQEPDLQKNVLDLTEQREGEDNLRMFNTMVEKCFSDCINDFRTRKMTSREELCVNRCAEKFLRHQQRVGKNLLEIQLQLEEERAVKAEGQRPSSMLLASESAK